MINPPYHETVNKLLYAILQHYEGNPIPMSVPRPPYYNVTNELLYAILNKLNGDSNVVPRKYQGTIQGDGAMVSFTITHNLDSEDIQITAREIEDNLRQVFLDNYPDPLDPKNKLIISFDFAPSALQSYKILIVG